MAGIKALRKIQLGAETTAGTAVAATTIWRGVGTMEDKREVVFPDEDVGYLSGVDRTYIPKLLAVLSMDETPATFEQFGYILEAGVKKVTPSQDGTGSDYIYTYTFPTTAVSTIRTYTIEGGDNQQEEESPYFFVDSFKLSGQAGEAWKMSANWQGQQVTASSFTGSLSLPSVEEILFSKSSLYIDAAGGTIGTTQKSSTFLSASLDVDTGIQPVFTGDGSLYFTFTKNTPPEVTLDITFEHDGTATAEKTNWRNETARQIRILSQGSSVSTAGTTYSVKTMNIDLAGKWETFEKLGERNGNDVVTGKFRARYNSTAALFAEILLVNDLSSLP